MQIYDMIVELVNVVTNFCDSNHFNAKTSVHLLHRATAAILTKV